MSFVRARRVTGSAMARHDPGFIGSLLVCYEQVVRQVLDSGVADAAIADALGDIGAQASLLHPVSRKVTINIEMEAPKGKTVTCFLSMQGA